MSRVPILFLWKQTCRASFVGRSRRWIILLSTCLPFPQVFLLM